MQILVTGAGGQIGSELVEALRRVKSADQVIATDIRPSAADGSGPQKRLDVRNGDRLHQLVEQHDVGVIYHLASLLSATGEKAPDDTWDVNMTGLKHVLDIAKGRNLKVFWPSSIAVFGPATPRDETPQQAVLDPQTMYGVTKVSGELLCRYYHQKFGVDVRSLRYPGLISYKAPPGGGTTDYAVEMFYAAAKDNAYTCFVRPDTRLPMMYMPDAIRAARELMAADADALTVRTSYNLGALSFTARELMGAMAARVPGFTCRFQPDGRQEIADAWPEAVDDTAAHTDWGWQPRFGLEEMVDDMLANLQERVSLEA